MWNSEKIKFCHDDDAGLAACENVTKKCPDESEKNFSEYFVHCAAGKGSSINFRE
jgi:hypothetical protein